MLLSIITINFNDAIGLHKTAETIAPQLSSSVEWIIIDGGSNDGSMGVIESYIESLSFYCSEKDSGIYDAMNKGIMQANGEYLWFVNSGDYLTEDAINNFFISVNDKEETHPDLILGGGYVRYCNKIDWYRKPRRGFYNAFHGLPALHQSTIYRRSLMPTSGYNISFDICADHWLAAFFVTKNRDKICYLDIALSIHPIHEGTAISNPLKLFRQSWEVQKEFYSCRSFVYRLFSAAKRLKSICLAKLMSKKFFVNSHFFKLTFSNKFIKVEK